MVPIVLASIPSSGMLSGMVTISGSLLVVRAFGTSCLVEGGVGHHTPVVALGFGFELHEAHRGAVLAADLDVQASTAAPVGVDGVYGPPPPRFDAQLRDVLRDGHDVELPVRGAHLRCHGSIITLCG